MTKKKKKNCLLMKRNRAVFVDSDDDNDDDTVELVNDNHLLFFSSIDSKSFFTLRRLLLQFEKKAEKSKKHLFIHINSPGGDAKIGLACYDIIKNMTIHTISVIEGSVSSAATLLALACKERLMTPHSTIMIHQVWCSLTGTFKEHEVELANTSALMGKYINIYVSETNMTKAQIIKELQSDSEISFKHAKQLGFVTDQPHC